MSLVLALLALTVVPQASVPGAATVTAEATTAETSARQWLALLDQGRWADSYRLTGSAFQRLNTLAVWTAASERVRAPLGAVVSRTLLSNEDMPAPPHGLQVVKFRTSFANKADAVETVTLDREGDSWRVVGVYVS